MCENRSRSIEISEVGSGGGGGSGAGGGLFAGGSGVWGWLMDWVGGVEGLGLTFGDDGCIGCGVGGGGCGDEGSTDVGWQVVVGIEEWEVLIFLDG